MYNKILKLLKKSINKISDTLFIIKVVLKGGEFNMVLVYVCALQKGLITFSTGVPDVMKPKVATALIQMDLEFLIDDPAYLPKTQA